MSKEVITALILMAKICAGTTDCATCPLKDFCGQTIDQW